MRPEESVLLIIDMEKAFVEPGAALCIAGAKKTVPVIAETVKTLREKGVEIIWVKRIYAADGSDVEIPRWRDLCSRGYEKAGVLSANSTGLNSIEEPEGLVPCESDKVIIKPRFSAFFGTDLHEYLVGKGIKNILLAGTTTPNCIRSTAYDAVSYDMEPVILDACCSSVSDEVQKANMDDMERIGMRVIHSADASEIVKEIFN